MRRVAETLQVHPSIHRSFLLMWRSRPDTFASTSLCPALPDAPPSSHSIQTSFSFPSLPFSSRSPSVYPSSSFPWVSKLTLPLHGCWVLFLMCLIYLQRLSRIVSLTGLVLVRRYSSSFEIFIGHLIFIIFFKQTRWNLSSLRSSVPVILHSSAPYSRTGITLLWNKPSFVFRLYDSDFNTFPSILKEFLSFESLFLVSASSPPSFFTVDRK